MWKNQGQGQGVNKSTVVEHPYCLRDRSVDDHTYPAHT